ncbi:hypothetical protein AVEN_98281-1 [Araneus ventricosus]|uniref:Uncharacterized protein n=1 Tax=Araneus ventricosus TaxID=182803 RepID=A0A4Y2IDK6_ARAVE|nr:hypothetical protein AVEN_98281-1 [Araneus ventricosus]
MSHLAIVRWCQQFEDDRTDLNDAERQGRRPITDMVQRVEYIILSNRRVSVAHNAQEYGISVGSAHSIVRHRLDYRKLCSRWVHFYLTSEHKGARFAASLEFLQRFSAEVNFCLIRIITGDETCLHHFNPEKKQASMA